MVGAAVKARLEELIPSRTVYLGAVPDGDLPSTYLLIYVAEGDEGSDRLCTVASYQMPAIWVHSISRHPDPMAAYDEAAWGAQEVRKALRAWAPIEHSHTLYPAGSQPATRDESVPGCTTYYAVEQFSSRIAL